jgi:hypothetical protein
MPPKKLRTDVAPTPVQRRTLRERFGIAPRTRNVDYTALRTQFNNELTEAQRQARNQRARDRRNPVRALVGGIIQRVVAKGKIEKLLRNAVFRRRLAKRVEARKDKRFLHTLNYDAYSTRVRGGNTFLQYEGRMSIQFQSRFRHPLRPFNFSEADGLWTNYAHRNQLPDVIPPLVNVLPYFDLEILIGNAMDQIPGSDGRVGCFLSIDILEIPRQDVRLVDMPMFRETVQSANPEFRGFVDSGNLECVPETILHHLNRWEDRKNKKYTLEEIKSILDCDFPKPAGCGYDTYDLTNCLRTLRCPWKLVDVENKVFSSNRDENVNRNLPVFVGQVWNNHLYYCSDDEYIKSLASAESFKTSNKQVVVKKKEKEFDGIVLPVDDLKDIFLQQFDIDKKFRRVSLYNNRIVGYELDAVKLPRKKKGEPKTKKPKPKWIYANPDLAIVKEVCQYIKTPFTNQSLTFLGKGIFEKMNPRHKSSQFNPDVYSHLQVNAGIVSVFANTTGEKQSSVDINKCRTSCLLDNQLGDYAVFGIADDIELYDEKPLRLGWYYVDTANQLPMRGPGWYSNQFLMYCRQENIEFRIIYQLIASSKISSNFAKTTVEELIKASPENYKTLVNTLIGYWGKTIGKYTEGYLETDFRFACQKFWDSDNVGTIYDLQDAIDVSNRKRLRVDKFKCVDIGELTYEGDEKIYMVQQTKASKLFVNDLPIYNKVLENEWIKCYELRKKLGGTLIKIKTDNVIVENATGTVEFSDTIGGYKDETNKETWNPLDISFYKQPDLQVPKVFKTYREWERTPVEWGDADNYFEKLKPKLPDKSFCLTGLAGYGKSECIKGCDWYNDPETLKVAFTNKATESMSGETICQAFGIDFTTGMALQSKINKCKSVKRIINDECFMTPSYAMCVFELIHQKYPEIQFIFVGDPNQTRPVGEEHINWLETSVFHNICGGKLVQLRENKRNDLTLEYFDLIDGKGIDITKFGKHTQSKINICRTNEYRRQINDAYMDKNGTFIQFDKEKHNPYGQDVWLKPGTPVMSVVNNRKRGLINSKMWVVESFGTIESFPQCLEQLDDDGAVVIGGQSFTHTEFMKLFVVAYAFTNHKVQSITIKEKFVIHEWDKMTPREQYTAFSRTSKREFVKIYN